MAWLHWKFSSDLVALVCRVCHKPSSKHNDFKHKLQDIFNEFLYAPNFEEVDGAYWFRVVGPCVRACVRPSVQELCMLGF